MGSDRFVFMRTFLSIPERLDTPFQPYRDRLECLDLAVGLQGFFITFLFHKISIKLSEFHCRSLINIKTSKRNSLNVISELEVTFGREKHVFFSNNLSRLFIAL
jgi:hypothetical protein